MISSRKHSSRSSFTEKVSIRTKVRSFAYVNKLGKVRNAFVFLEDVAFFYHLGYLVSPARQGFNVEASRTVQDFVVCAEVAPTHIF